MPTASAGGDQSIQIDIDFERVVLDEISKLEPNTGRSVISEEAGGTLSIGSRKPEVVVIDPVDGSKNAACGIPQFSVSIAVATGPTMADVWFGYVYDFGTDEEHVAATDPGSATTSVGREATPRFVGCESAEPALIAVGARELEDYGIDELRVVGSIAISLSYLAKNRLVGVLTCKGCRSVDAAAGQLIARSAGYQVLFDGRPPEQASLDLDGEYRVVAGRGELVEVLNRAQQQIPLMPR